MFFRKIVCRRNGKEYTYLKLIETYREGGKVKQRVIGNLGNLDNLTPEKIESLILGLRKIYDLKDLPSHPIDSSAEENNLKDNSSHLKANTPSSFLMRPGHNCKG